ncbi:hypothetical protein PMAYCL1PPCAC_14264, partial [Pristionchus mayeri]
SQSKTMNKEENDDEMDKNELKCPECEYRSRSPNAWIKHIKYTHSTTPALCEIANFTVIRKGDGPIRRLTDYPNSSETVEEEKRR